MKKIKQRVILAAALLSLSAYLPAISAPVADVPAGIGGYGGALNTHDMMMIQEKLRMEREKEDLQNLQDRRDGKETEKEDIIEGDPETGEKIYNEETAKKLKKKNLKKNRI